MGKSFAEIVQANAKTAWEVSIEEIKQALQDVGFAGLKFEGKFYSDLEFQYCSFTGTYRRVKVKLTLSNRGNSIWCDKVDGYSMNPEALVKKLDKVIK